ncbi:hypothetical protein Veis_3581 [Verminephrobacter eiseniae EF01-2]|uniref:Uncharacterized protein n=1 Tax=Verminephrobacter eiseniae (strain EF01-2) TaxID=391735 RepID=A1WNU2_VEREI|nr:hypothetical protein Veis_3581 [Verminephrobacter eiseniae EF01-2]
MAEVMMMALGGVNRDASPVSRHRSDVVDCAQPSERSARRIACPYRAVLASDATPRCASMASADRQMIGDATLAGLRSFDKALEPEHWARYIAQFSNQSTAVEQEIA